MALMKIYNSGYQQDVGSGLEPANQTEPPIRKPRPVVLCGPSGSGKSTLQKMLTNDFGDLFGFSVSHTTRKPRPGEVHGKDYFFVDVETMEEAIGNGEFIEYTKFSGNYYGTSKMAVKMVQEAGRICILDIEIEGVKNLKKTGLNPRYVFIKPPSYEELEQRLRKRGTETDDSIRQRLERARDEIRYGDGDGHFDVVIVNDDLDAAYQKLKLFLAQEIEAAKFMARNAGY